MGGEIPVTSVSLIRTISGDAGSARWAEFYEKYHSTMLSYLQGVFPSLDPDDIIQETMAALVKALPGYVYMPDDKGHFRNYLVGILKHKAMDALKRRAKEASILDKYKDACQSGGDDAADSIQRDVLEIALQQLFADPAANPMHKNVFRQIALCRRPAAEVADEYGITRTNADVIKKRMLDRLASIVRRLSVAVG